MNIFKYNPELMNLQEFLRFCYIFVCVVINTLDILKLMS